MKHHKIEPRFYMKYLKSLSLESLKKEIRYNEIFGLTKRLDMALDYLDEIEGVQN